MSDIREKLVGMTKSASKATGDLFKTTKLNISHANEQANLKNLYVEIGQKVHEIYRYGGTLGALFDAYYEKITASEQKSAEIKAQLALIKGLRDCPNCGKTVEMTAEFCAKCGAALTGEGAPPQDTAPHDITSHDAAPPYTPPTPYVPAEQLPLPPAAAPPLPAPTAPAPVICRVCKTENDPGTKFCLSCGRMVY